MDAYIVNYQLTIEGNLDRFLAIYKDKLAYIPQLKRWLVFDNHWKETSEFKVVDRYLSVMDLLKQQANEYLHDKQREEIIAFANKSKKYATAKRVIELARGALAKPPTEFDMNLDILNAPNGIVYLYSGEKGGADPNRCCSKVTTYEYDETAQCPTWLEFLYAITNSAKFESVFSASSPVDYLQRAVGYTLTGHTFERVIFVVQGSAAFIFLNILSAILGSYAYHASYDIFKLKKHWVTQYNLSEMRGTRMIICNPPKSLLFRDREITTITWRDSITARAPYRQAYTYKPTYKVWVHMPQEYQFDIDNACTERQIHHYRLRDNKMVDTAEDSLINALLAEGQGILAWAVKGSYKWHRFGLCRP